MTAMTLIHAIAEIQRIEAELDNLHQTTHLATRQAREEMMETRDFASKEALALDKLRKASTHSDRLRSALIQYRYRLQDAVLLLDVNTNGGAR